MTTHTQPESDHTMQCMEVWGGNTASDNGVVMPGLDAWVYSRPHAGDAGGGDVHYVSSCATGRITRLLIADVSGHGQGVAEVAVTLRNLMRRYINFVDQTRLVQSLNAEFTRQSQMGRFATAVIATYWAPTNDLVVCNAGHPRPMLYRSRLKRWEALNSGAAKYKQTSVVNDNHEAPTFVNLPFGIDDLAGYEQFGIELRPDDLVLFYTDSMIECMNPATGRLLGEDGFLSLLNELGCQDAASFIPNLLKRLDVMAAGRQLEDDATLLLLRHNGSVVKRATLQGLIAPFRIAWAAIAPRVRGERTPMGIPEMTVWGIGGAVIPALNRLWKPRKK